MRWVAASFVCLVFATIGAVIGVSLFLANAPNGANGLIGAMFVAPVYGIVGALLGVIPGVVVFRRVEKAFSRER